MGKASPVHRCGFRRRPAPPSQPRLATSRPPQALASEDCAKARLQLCATKDALCLPFLTLAGSNLAAVAAFAKDHCPVPEAWPVEGVYVSANTGRLRAHARRQGLGAGGRESQASLSNEATLSLTPRCWARGAYPCLS